MKDKMWLDKCRADLNRARTACNNQKHIITDLEARLANTETALKRVSDYNGRLEYRLAAAETNARNSPAIAAIEYALSHDDSETFLRLWFMGDFETLRVEWDDVPDAVFIGADPLFEPNAIDALLWIENVATDDQLDSPVPSLEGRTGRDLLAAAQKQGGDDIALCGPRHDDLLNECGNPIL